MTDASFDRIHQKQRIYILVDGEGMELHGSASLTQEQYDEVAPEWEREEYLLIPWRPQFGDRVRFCEPGGGEGGVVEVLQNGNAVAVLWDDPSPRIEIWDTIMLDPVSVQGYEGAIEIC
ncbi:MAG: hypothetical protein ACHWZW_02790 [Spirulina sp.]